MAVGPSEHAHQVLRSCICTHTPAAVPAHSMLGACSPDRTCVRPVKVATRRQPTARPARLSSDPRTVGLLTLQATGMQMAARPVQVITCFRRASTPHAVLQGHLCR